MELDRKARVVRFFTLTIAYEKALLPWEISFSSERFRSSLKFLGGNGG